MTQAKEYQLQITEGHLEFSRGFTRPITEYHIPSVNVTFNTIGSIVHVFRPLEDRYKEFDSVTDVVLSDTFVEKLNEFVKHKEAMEEKIKAFCSAAEHC